MRPARPRLLGHTPPSGLHKASTLVCGGSLFLRMQGRLLAGSAGRRERGLRVAATLRALEPWFQARVSCVRCAGRKRSIQNTVLGLWGRNGSVRGTIFDHGWAPCEAAGRPRARLQGCDVGEDGPAQFGCGAGVRLGDGLLRDLEQVNRDRDVSGWRFRRVWRREKGDEMLMEIAQLSP